MAKMADEFIYIVVCKFDDKECEHRDELSWVDYGGNNEYCAQNI